VARGVGRKLGTVPKGYCDAKCHKEATASQGGGGGGDGGGDGGGATVALGPLDSLGSTVDPFKGISLSLAPIRPYSHKVRQIRNDEYQSGDGGRGISTDGGVTTTVKSVRRKATPPKAPPQASSQALSTPPPVPPAVPRSTKPQSEDIVPGKEMDFL
jgi:hypothetical protein